MLDPAQREALERLRKEQKPPQMPLELPIERLPVFEEYYSGEDPSKRNDEGAVNPSYFSIQTYQ